MSTHYWYEETPHDRCRHVGYLREMGLGVSVCVWWGGGGGEGCDGVQLEVVQSRATAFITGTTELPAAPAR